MTTDTAPGIRLTVVKSEGSAPGTIWPVQDRVLAFRISMQANATDKLVLNMRNDDLRLLGYPAVQHGTTLDVRWRYPTRMSVARRVYLEVFRGFTDLQLTFTGCERPLTLEARTRSWPDASIASVVREVAGRHGYSGALLHIDAPSSNRATIMQAAETDAALLQRLATEHGPDFFVDGDGLHWQKAQKCRAPMIMLRYMDSAITDISFSSNLARHVGRVETRGRDPLRKSTITASANATSANRDTLAEHVEIVDAEKYANASQKENAKLALHPTPAASHQAAHAESERRFTSSEHASIEARICLVGEPRLCARSVVALSGVTPDLSGNYYVREATHAIDENGYSTDRELVSDGVGLGQGKSSTPQGGNRNVQRSPNESPSQVEVVDEERYLTTKEHRDAP